MLDRLSGLVKILKHLARLSLQVMEGLKMISPFVALASRFFCFLCLVRERLSCGSPRRSGSSLGKIRWILVRASEVQVCGFRQPQDLSSEQSRQGQDGVGRCDVMVGLERSLAEVWSKSATVETK